MSLIRKKGKPRILVVTPEITYLPAGMGNLAHRANAKAGGLADVDVGGIRLGDDFVYTLTQTRTGLQDSVPYRELTPREDFENELGLKLSGGAFTTGDPENPKVGDVRIRYYVIPTSVYEEKIFCFGTLRGGELCDPEGKDGFMLSGCASVGDALDHVAGSRKSNMRFLYGLAGTNAAAAAVVYVVIMIIRRKGASR